MTLGAHLFDHTVTVWGSQQLRGATFGDATRQFSKVPGQDDVRIALQVRRETRQDAGPGERTVGEYNGYGPAAMDVIEGDLIEIIAGTEADPDPNQTRLLKVESCYKPRGHHTQLVMRHYDGRLS